MDVLKGDFLRGVLCFDAHRASPNRFLSCDHMPLISYMVVLFSLAFIFCSIVPQDAYAMGSTGIIIPLYSYPGSFWDAIMHEKNAHSSVPVIAIINPANGPGIDDPNYAAGVQGLHKAGIVVLGYTDTRYATRNATEIESEMNSYKNWYGVDGIFLDRMSNVAGNETFYSQLTSYAKSIGLSYTVGNPGADTVPSYIGTVDNIVIHDRQGLVPISLFGGWHENFTKSNFSVISYGVNDINKTYIDNVMKFVKYLYVTDLTTPNPFISPSSYIDKLIGMIDDAEQNNNMVKVNVKSYTDEDRPLRGFWTSVQSGKNDTSGFSPFSFNATVGQQYEVSVANFGNYVFEHWDDGTTKNPRAIVPAQNVTLTAYYGMKQDALNYSADISNPTNSNQTSVPVSNQTLSSGISNQTQVTAALHPLIQTSQGIGQTKDAGSIIVNTMYPSGDRADFSALSFKVFQDTNQSVYRQIDSVPSNPFYIGHLPLNHRYKVEVFVNGMCSDIQYVSLEHPTAQLKMFLPLPVGMRLDVLYDDGFTPVSSAMVAVVSQDNKTQASGSTDSSGESLRFWLEPTSQNAFYTIDVTVGKNISYSYSPVLLYPGFETVSGYDQEIRIVTPWPSPSDNSVHVKVYDARSRPYTPRDGNLVVRMFDGAGTKIAESQVDPRGEADFTNIKVGDYVLRAQDPQKDMQWGDSEITLDGKTKNFAIYETLKSQENQTTVASSSQNAPSAND